MNKTMTLHQSSDFMVRSKSKQTIKPAYDASVTGNRYASSKARLGKIESKVADLQRSMTDTAQRLHLELVKESYLENEVAQLKSKLSEMREAKQKHLRKPKVLSKDLDTMNNKKKHLVQTLNETTGKNVIARETIKDMRKERAIMDTMYTNLEKDILTKENKLLLFISKEENLRKQLRDRTEQLEKLKVHIHEEKLAFESKYEEITNKMDFENEFRSSLSLN